MISDLDRFYIQKVLSGDKEEFRYFIRTYKEMAYSIAISIVKNDVEANDVVQTSFIRSYKCLRSFRQDAKFSSWLYKIVVNEALKHIKKSRNLTQVSQIEESDNLPSVDNDAITNLEETERNKQIDKVLLLMKPKEALVLKLFYLHEESIDQIADITGFSKSNVKVLLHRARKSFSSLFNQQKE